MRTRVEAEARKSRIRIPKEDVARIVEIARGDLDWAATLLAISPAELAHWMAKHRIHTGNAGQESEQ